jgi:hypothetical protein
MDVKEPQGPRHICYDHDSIPAAYSAFELMAIIRERSFLSKIEKPLLIMQSKLDPVIHPSSAEHIFRRVSAPSKELVMLEDCYHTITVDKERSNRGGQDERVLCAVQLNIKRQWDKDTGALGTKKKWKTKKISKLKPLPGSSGAPSFRGMGPFQKKRCGAAPSRGRQPPPLKGWR